MGRLADQLFGRAFVDDEEERLRRFEEPPRKGLGDLKREDEAAMNAVKAKPSYRQFRETLYERGGAPNVELPSEEEWDRLPPERAAEILGAPEKLPPRNEAIESDLTVPMLLAGPLTAGVSALGAGATARGVAGAVAKDAALQIPLEYASQAGAAVGEEIGGAPGEIVGGMLAPVAGAMAASKIGKMARGGPVSALRRPEPEAVPAAAPAPSPLPVAPVADAPAAEAASLLDRYGNAIDNSAEALAAEEAHAQSVLERLRAKSEALREQAPPRSPEELFREGLRDEREAQSRYESFRGRLEAAQEHAGAGDSPADARERARVAAHAAWKRRQEAYDPRLDETLQGHVTGAERATILRGDAAAEAAAREAERTPATIDAAFSDPTDKARATTRASTLDLGGERGAALIPGGKELKEFASHFQFQPKLEEFMLKPGYTVADAAARLRTANAAEPWLATRESKSILRDVPLGERFRAWITGSQTKDAIAFRQYVEAADELENLKRGQVVASGRDRGALAADMAQAENAIGKPRMDELRARLKGITDTSFDELVAAGEADPSMYRPDYVRNIYTEKARERMTAFGGSGAGGFGAAKPGATNARKGFEGDKEDVLSATAFGRYEAGKAYNFAKTIRDPVVEKFGLNEALRLDPQGALAGDTVLFTFDHGVSNRIINQYDTKRVLAGMDPVQLNPALKTQAFQLPGPAGKTVKYHAIPGPLAEGLADLMANEGEFGKFSQVMAKANQATTTSLLSFPITNLPYEVGQLMSDTGSALQAVAGMGGVKDILTGKGPRILVKESAKALRELAAEYTNVYWRKLRPTLIRDLTRKNLFGVNWESMYEDISDAAPEVARLVSENALPMHERGKGAAAKAVFLSPYAITDLVGKARESTLMRGVTKAAETLIPGMSSEGATALARARMGGYDKKSAAGRAFAPLMLFHKWFLSAAQNLTTRAVQDPLTKKWGGWKRLPQNMAKSPLVGVGITYALLKAWNRGAMGEWGREVEDNVLPSTQTAAFVMPVTDKGEYVGPGADLSKVTGKPVVIEPETFLQMVLAGIGGAFDAATGKSGRAAEDLARFTASRGAPIVRGPIEALMGQRIKDSSSIAGKFSDASNERQAAELGRRGVPWAGALEKLPFSPMGTEHVLEQLSYAPSFTRRTLDPNQTAWERAQTLGSPFRVVEPNAKEFEAKMRDTKRVMAEIDRENTKANPDKAKIDALKNQLRELGADQQATKGQLTRWRRATQEAESRTRPEREEKKYRRLPDRFRKWLKEKSEVPPAPSGGPP